MPSVIIPLALAATCFAAAMYACWRANAIVYEIVRQINQSDPPSEQESIYVWYPSRRNRVIEKYKSLFPDGDLLKRSRIYTGLALVAMFGFLICLMSSGI